MTPSVDKCPGFGKMTEAMFRLEYKLGKAGLALRVPSALVPSESNFLINPVHVDIRRPRIVRKWPLRFDPRFADR